MTELVCSVCLYVPTRPGLDADSLAETETLTVISGHMVCVRHAPMARGTHHEAIAAAARMESGDEHITLSGWQETFRAASGGGVEG